MHNIKATIGYNISQIFSDISEFSYDNIYTDIWDITSDTIRFGDNLNPNIWDNICDTIEDYNLLINHTLFNIKNYDKYKTCNI